MNNASHHGLWASIKNTWWAVAILLLVGCFIIRSMRSHSRPIGHGDISVAASLADNLLIFNGIGVGGRDLYLLDLNDFDVSRIAETPEYEVDPSFSADGQQIVYAAGVPNDRADHLFTMKVNGSQKRQLTNRDANDSAPQFSPDASKIVFVRDNVYKWGGLAANWSIRGAICLINADGTQERELIRQEAFAFLPRFSRDGSQIFFQTSDGQFSINLDGKAPPRQMSKVANNARFSPDGQLIVYAQGQYESTQTMFVSSIEGQIRLKMECGQGGCYDLQFSRSGEQIFFLKAFWPTGTTGQPKRVLWQMNVNDSTAKPIATSSLFDAPLSRHEASRLP